MYPQITVSVTVAILVTLAIFQYVMVSQEMKAMSVTQEGNVFLPTIAHAIWVTMVVNASSTCVLARTVQIHWFVQPLATVLH